MMHLDPNIFTYYNTVMKVILILQALLVCVQCYKLPMSNGSDDDSDDLVINPAKEVEDSKLAPVVPNGVSAVGVAVPANLKLRTGPQLGVKIV